MNDASDRNRLTRRIVLGMIAGTLTGLALHASGPAPMAETVLVDGVFYAGGQIFLRSLKLLVVPLVFVSLACGTAALDDVTRLGRVGLRTLGLYLGTTAMALTLALTLASITNPGVGFDLPSDAAYTASEGPGLVETLIDMFPANPIEAMAEGRMLQVIIFAGLFGVAMTLAGDPGRRVLATLRDWNEIILRMVLMMMSVAPIGVFCLLARVFATEGIDALAPLARYFVTVAAALVLHATLTYPLLLKALARLPIRTFFRNVRPVAAVAFSTASSNATLPLTLETAEHRCGVSNSIASFTVPLGATVNMDGTAIMQGVATCFIAQAYGIELGLGAYLSVILTATLASVGAAGVPGVGLVTLAMVLRQVDLPVEGIALVLGVDRLLDMIRTSVNVVGDLTVTCVVGRLENELDEARFIEESQ